MKKLKRLCGMVIAAVMAICCLNLNSTEAMAAAKSTLTINERKAPTTLTVGSSWTVTGTITSNYNITWIGGYILKSDHSTIAVQTGAKPNSKTYSLKNSVVDRNLDFGKLAIGSYYYKITAHDASGQALTLIDAPFKVVAKTQAASTLKISGSSNPPTLTQGGSWTATGTITSNYNITWVGGYILGSDAKSIVDSSSAKPNTKSYNLKNSVVDRNLDFNKLKPGTYYYKITAHDASGKALTLKNVKFVVKAKTQAASTLKISGSGNPPTLTEGGSWTATGTITSNYNITWVGGYILASNTKSIVDSSSAKPNTKSYNLKNSVVDRNLDFNKLKPGTYYYKITAHDVSGKALTLKNVKFVVKALPSGVNFRWPTDGAVKQNISSKYGFRRYIDKNGKWTTDYHLGIDITGKEGSNIRAAEAGKVVKVDDMGGLGYGKYIIIRHNNGYYTLYGHCSAINVQVGSTVTRGQIIGKIGQTGSATGPHVHFEVRRDSKLGDGKQYADEKLFNPLDSRFTYSK